MKNQIAVACVALLFAFAVVSFSAEGPATGGDQPAPPAGTGKVVLLDEPASAKESPIKIEKFEFGSGSPLEISVEGSAKYPDGARVTVSIELAETVRGIPVLRENVFVKQGKFASKFKLEPGLALLSAFYAAYAEFDPERQDPALIEKLGAASESARRASAKDVKLFGTAESRKAQLENIRTSFGTYLDVCATFYNEINSKFVEYRPAVKKPADAPKTPADNASEAADESLSSGDAAAPSANASDFSGAKETA